MFKTVSGVVKAAYSWKGEGHPTIPLAFTGCLAVTTIAATSVAGILLAGALLSDEKPKKETAPISHRETKR